MFNFPTQLAEKGEDIKPSPSRSKRSCAELIGRCLIRSLQIILAIVVAGLYGYRVNAERAAHSPVPSQWVYAEVVAGLSAITAIVYLLPLVPSHKAFVWDAILFVLWSACFGVFAHIYLHRYRGDVQYEGTDTARMRSAMWTDLVNMALWGLTAAYGAAKFIKNRQFSQGNAASASQIV